MKRLFAISGMALLLSASLASAKELTPKEIITRSLDQQVFRSKGVELRMVMRLKNKRGETRERELFTRSKRTDGMSRTLVRFISPADVAGTSFLFMERKDRDDDQYMYLPALKAVRRIVGSQKNASFMGSDFSYADLEWGSLEDANYKRHADEKLGKADCYVIDSVPHKKDAYSRLRAWVRKADNTLLRLQFFDMAGKLKKVLYIKEVKKIGGSLLATRLKMANKQTGHSTWLAMTKIKLRDDIDDAQFQVRALRK
jgi:hypothetical protein